MAAIKMKEINSLQNPIVKHLVRLRQNRDYRDEHQSVLIESLKLISEVAPYHPIKTLLVYDQLNIPQGIAAKDAYIVSEAIMKKVSGLQTPEGIVAEVAKPAKGSLKGKKYILACDCISDPGNLGTLLRSALALGWEGAFILENSCDPFNDKALRAAKGATFRLPLAFGSWKDLEALIKQNRLTPLVADIKGEPIDGKRPEALLVLSNEAHGLSEEAARICKRITIPMSGQMESLNVAAAGAILMFELNRVNNEA